MQFPDGGELFKAAEKKSEHLVFFAHFFKGHKKALRRHIDLVNELGFDAYAFNLKDDLKDHKYVPYSHVSKKFGMKHVLAEQIGHHLDLLTHYKTKIIFAFSNVAGCAIEAHTRRLKEGQNDVVAMVCDSGPGAGNFFQSSYMLLQEQIGVESLSLKLLGTPAVAFGWSPKLNKDIRHDLDSFPEGFPILSIRGWRDRLITPMDIDKVFDHHKNLNWKKLSLPEAGHLNGLRDFPSEYKPGVEDFLNQFRH
ncbi:MAG: TMEM53 family protein [Pseudobdellovibrio sp.]|nr:TMEM53 family protein [Pseudobdellovibrio sp.]